ncbi:hypothetical protein B0A55_02984 [Friedmanniomyces simplex]|uniref:Amidohydrolase-related domain-containing protein n=1 Tax=Friedmanniomyces simplex TaxID=329884 RepID=A0A4U0XZS0_9PEZI|nr:hypothetical protein B0A55_02984 [Friedmanniomyces simplex]
MAAAFLQSHGIDVDAEMQRIQFGQDGRQNSTESPSTGRRVKSVINASLPGTPPGSLWDVHLDPSSGCISFIHPSSTRSDREDCSTSTPGNNSSGVVIDAQHALLTPSLCHPHIHLDKAYLLSHPKYSHLLMERGGFAEAMELTGKAKAQFTHQDLLERGQRLIDESAAASVTHMRAFIELDAGVGKKCLDAGLELKRKAKREGRCRMQICAFAQLPLFTASQDDPDGAVIRGLMEEAAVAEEVEALGSTPYVEADREKMERNVSWLVDLAIKHNKHLDFHLDYNLNAETEPLIWHVISVLKVKEWTTSNPDRTIVLGHCTRLTLFSAPEWQRLASLIRDSGLPVSFVGLPTSDLFILHQTLDIPRLIKEYGLNACIGVNNIGNAFTPHGSCDPLTLACQGMGVYQAGTERDAELLFECVSTRAREAIGFGRRRVGKGGFSGEAAGKGGEKAEDSGGNTDVERAEEKTKERESEEAADVDADVGLQLREGDPATLLLFGHEKDAWRTRKTVAEAVYLG